VAKNDAAFSGLYPRRSYSFVVPGSQCPAAFCTSSSWLRQEQRRAAAKAAQPALFELREDVRPATQRTAAGRYLEPSLFSLLGA
jgi:hypothetical protein